MQGNLGFQCGCDLRGRNFNGFQPSCPARLRADAEFLHRCPADDAGAIGELSNQHLSRVSAPGDGHRRAASVKHEDADGNMARGACENDQSVSSAHSLPSPLISGSGGVEHFLLRGHLGAVGE